MTVAAEDTGWAVDDRDALVLDREQTVGGVRPLTHVEDQVRGRQWAGEYVGFRCPRDLPAQRREA
jgi:hypothetical protein